MVADIACGDHDGKVVVDSCQINELGHQLDVGGKNGKQPKEVFEPQVSSNRTM